MAKRRKKRDHYSGIGGQAVIEGIMMKNKDMYSVAIRTPSNEIEVALEEYDSFTPAKIFTQIPFIRGVFNFIDSLILGIRTLNYSATFYEEPSTRRKKRPKLLERILGENSDKILSGITVCISVMFAVFLFMLLPYFLSQLFRMFIVNETVITIIEAVLRVAIFVLYVVLISRLEDIKRVFMYHGAEHKCINCLESGRALTIENVRRSSRLHKRCGTSFLFYVIFISIILFLFIRVNDPVMRVVIRLLLIPVIASIAYEIIRLAGRSNNIIVRLLSYPGMMLQKLTTKEPDDDMIEVGIAAVSAVFEWKSFLITEFNYDVDAEEEETLKDDLLKLF